ncbi:MAG TPA: DHA2 family efflux MFS transporter permease subunit [Ktedonobacteraceae bacterium]|nr:DHA2 family efflux MFS transporter permease subunit [Ktedonobacteraceae bacterium]
MHFTYRWQATLVIALGLLMAILDATIVSVVLPQMATAFKTDYQTITWVATGYFLANAAIIPIVGYISDRIGSKTIFLIALGIFTISSLLCAFASNEQVLIAFRVLQGVGGGALLPVAMAMIFRLFEPTERAGAIALLMIPLLLGPAFGPTLGGYLATNYSWNTIFLINLPIGVVAFILSLIMLRGRSAESTANGTELSLTAGTRRFDWLGLLLAVVGFTALVYGLSSAGSDGWGNSRVLIALIGGGIVLIAFVWTELLVKDPVIDIRLFSNYTFTISNILIWATTGVLFGSIFLLPLFFERVQGLSALTTGEIVISQGLAMAVGLAFSGKLYNRVGPRLLSVAGAALVAISMIGFLHLDVKTTGASLQIWLILRGLGLGLVGQPLQTLAVSGVSKPQMAKATSLMNSTKTVFGAVGVAVLTSYLTQQAGVHAQSALNACIQAGQTTQAALQLCATQQATTMGMNDTFLLSLIGCAICAVAAIFVGRDPALDAANAAKKRGETVEKVETEPASMV